MAIQNLVAGGFYGKVGALVGQRWRNLRTVRAHVIPANPRTEKQQANRAIFAEATKLAQIAFQVNRGSNLWDTTKTPQFAQLVATARRRLKAGLPPSQAIPFFPDGHISDMLLSNPNINWSAWPSQVSFDVPGQTFTTSRELEILIFAKNEIKNEWEFVKDFITVPSGGLFSYTFNQANTYSLPDGASIHVISTDDAANAGTSVEMPEFSFVQPGLPNVNYIFTLPVLEVDPPNVWRGFYVFLERFTDFDTTFYEPMLFFNSSNFSDSLEGHYYIDFSHGYLSWDIVSHDTVDFIIDRATIPEFKSTINMHTCILNFIIEAQTIELEPIFPP